MWVHIERPILTQKHPLSNNRENRMHGLEEVIHEFISDVLMGSAQ
jgi:hypothetical protein